MTTPRLLIIGPQGSGKGTQGERIAETYGIPAVSTGDVFRANVKDGTPLGRQVKAIIDAGDLVPDELTGEIVRDRLSQDDAAQGFLLDGYPRNLGQVGDLDAFLDERGAPLTAVIDEAAGVIAEYNPHRARPRSLDGLRKVLRLREDNRWIWRWKDCGGIPRPPRRTRSRNCRPACTPSPTSSTACC